MRKTAVLIASALFVSLVVAGATQAHAATCWRVRAPEVALTAETNKQRSAAGLSELKFDVDLAKVARRHSKHMANRGELFHSTPDAIRSVLVPGTWGVVKENVGSAEEVGLASMDMRRLARAFMDSSTHRMNILDPDNRAMGVGIVKARGKYWVTVLFSAKPNPETILSMRDC